ncbi:MAG: M48 family metallopeptidase [Candidatus Pacebacteria bacterium]|nr:M48 family metallopeptidase [Candidatus Paceibacterota bacterium]
MKKILKIFFGPYKKKYKKKRPTISLGLDKKEYQNKKNEFLVIANKKTVFFNEFYKFEYNKISIRNQKTRWGSCSSRKSLNFNYRIFLLSEDLMDYIIVHEICHLQEMNHSKSFWDLVEKKIPDYKKKRLELKKYYFIN